MAFDVRPSVATVGVIGLAAVAAGLAYLALSGNGSSAPSPAPVVLASLTPTATPTPTSTATLSASPTPSPTATVVVAVPQLPLVVVSADESWRSTGGSCTAGDVSAVQTTKDGGATWTRVTSPLAQVLTLTPAGSSGVTAGGLDSSCALKFRTSYDDGANWPLDAPGRGVWTPSGRTVVAPSGDTGSACKRGAVVGVEGASATTAYVLCSDGTIRTTDDSAATFTKAATRRGAVALARGSDGTLYVAVRGDAGCAGTRIEASGDDGGSWTKPACVAGAKGTKAAGLGVGGSVLVLVDGSTTFRSTNGGVTWSKQSG